MSAQRSLHGDQSRVEPLASSVPSPLPRAARSRRDQEDRVRHPRHRAAHGVRQPAREVDEAALELLRHALEVQDHGLVLLDAVADLLGVVEPAGLDHVHPGGGRRHRPHDRGRDTVTPDWAARRAGAAAPPARRRSGPGARCTSRSGRDRRTATVRDQGGRRPTGARHRRGPRTARHVPIGGVGPRVSGCWSVYAWSGAAAEP